jgi:hypothetical protein
MPDYFVKLKYPQASGPNSKIFSDKAKNYQCPSCPLYYKALRPAKTSKFFQNLSENAKFFIILRKNTKKHCHFQAVGPVGIFLLYSLSDGWVGRCRYYYIKKSLSIIIKYYYRAPIFSSWR